MTITSVTSTSPSSGATVTSGNELLVVGGGSATSTTVLSGGLLYVSSGGVETSATVQSGGSETIYGSASYDQIYGLVYVPPSGTVNSETVHSGGVLSTMNNGTANNTIVEGGGKLITQGSATITNITLEGSGAMLVLPGGRFPNAGSIVLENGGNIIEYTYGFTPSGPNFLSTNNNAVITGFSPTDEIDFTGVAYNAATEYLTYTTSGGITTVSFISGTSTDGTTPYVVDTFKFDEADYNGEMYLQADASGGTEIKSYVACYCSGTMISTDKGEVPVETLKIGDHVATASGEARPIKWIGKRSYGGRFILGQKDILPVCIKKNALAENVPHRDLWISPHHAMLLDGVLIEAKDLLNDVTIYQADTAEEVSYYHLELDSHDVIVAEGALSESFVDDNTRNMFSNAHEYAALYPDQTPAFVRYYAPRVESGAEVEAIRQQLSARARMINQDRKRA